MPISSSLTISNTSPAEDASAQTLGNPQSDVRGGEEEEVVGGAPPSCNQHFLV